MIDMKAFVEERNKVFTDFVMNDDIAGFLAYCVKYGMALDLPSNPNVMKAGIYKAVQECTGIPDEVKAVAKEKCVALGFSWKRTF